MPRSAATPARTVDEVVRMVEARWQAETPAAIKIRWDGDRTRQDHDIAGDIAKAKAVRKLVGDDFPLAFDANNGYSVGGAIRVGRALEELGYRLVRGAGAALRRARHGRGGAAARHHRLGRRADLHHAGAGRHDRRRRAHGAARHRQDGRHHRADAVRRRSATRMASSWCRTRRSRPSATSPTCTCWRPSCT